jgi:hypothetical protein
MTCGSCLRGQNKQFLKENQQKKITNQHFHEVCHKHDIRIVYDDFGLDDKYHIIIKLCQLVQNAIN